MNALRPTDSRPTSPALPVDGARSGSASAQNGSADAAALTSASTDQVDISPEARARAAEARGSASPEIETARMALRSESLSDARLHELRERVRTGHYNQPETIDRIASAAARDLAAD